MSEIKRVAFTTNEQNSTVIEGGGSILTCELPELVAGKKTPPDVSNRVAASSTTKNVLPDALMIQKSAVVMPAPLSPYTPASRDHAAKTIRLNLELFATNSNTFPEFNYSKLVHLEKKKQKKLKQKLNGFTVSFDDQDDDVARIAKELERKYGSSYASGRGRSKKDDHCDIGLGYDESDSFIDNTEAYDEVIPEEVETVEGGFYINSGALEFKKLSLCVKTDEIIKIPKKLRKRPISSEDSSSSTDDDDKTEPIEKRHKYETANDRKQEMEQEKEKEKNENITQVIGKIVPTINLPKANTPTASDLENEKNRLKTVKTTTVKDMLKAKRDNFLKMQENVPNSSFSKTSSTGEVKGSSNTSDDDSSGDESSSSTRINSDSNKGDNQKKEEANVVGDEGSEKYRSSDTKLPDLSKEQMNYIQEFKNIAKIKNYFGKKFQFDEQITEIFLRIDNSCLSLEKANRNMIFAHLEYNLSLPKYYFLRKAKQLRVKDEKSKLKRALAKLRKSVDEIMPTILNAYDQELKKFTEYQSASSGMAAVVQLENVPKPPKKKFIWTEPVRILLFDVYQVRWISYSILGTRKESFEDFISVFLKEKVLPIWPPGWMKYEELQKEIERRKNNIKKLNDKKGSPAINEVKYSQCTSSSSVVDLERHEESRTITMGCAIQQCVSPSDMESNIRFKEKNLKIKQQAQLLPQITIEKISRDSHGINQMNIDTTNKPGQTFAMDLVSPFKQRTDHSISSIISSPSSSCSSASTTPQPMQYMPQALIQQHSNKGPTAKANTQDIQQIFSTATDAMGTTCNQFVNNYNVTNDQQYGNPTHLGKSRQRQENSSSESDGVEIVGVFPPDKKTVILNKNKFKKNDESNQESRSHTPNMNCASSSFAFNSKPKSLNGKHKNVKKALSSINKISNETGSADFDVKKVVKVLKELQEMEKLQKQSNAFNNLKDMNQ